MEIEKIKEILRNKKFEFNKELSEEVNEEYSLETYTKREDFVEIFSTSKGVEEIFISNSQYNFMTDDSGRGGINLRYYQDRHAKYSLNEKNFEYCLEIQEYPRRHMTNFCKFYLKFIDWSNQELIPVLYYLGFKDSFSSQFNDGFFQLPISFFYQKEYNSYISLDINPLTLEITFHIGSFDGTEKDLNGIFGEPSDIILMALEEYYDLQNSSTKP